MVLEHLIFFLKAHPFKEESMVVFEILLFGLCFVFYYFFFNAHKVLKVAWKIGFYWISA